MDSIFTLNMVKWIIYLTLFMSWDKITPDINPKCGQMHWPCPDISKKDKTLVCKSHGIGDSLISPMYRCSIKISRNINPIYVGIERSFPDDSKNVSFAEMGLIQAVLQII